MDMSHLTPGPDHAAPVTYDVVSPKTIEPKTQAAAIGGGVGGAVALFIVWALDAIFWNGDAAPEVPGPVSGLVWVVVPAAVAFVASYVARHVNRVPLDG